MLRAAARHPAVAEPDDPVARALHDRTHLVGGLVAHQPWVGHHPDRRRGLDRAQWRHLSAGVKLDVVVGEILALEVGLAGSEQLVDDLETLLEYGRAVGEGETQGVELAPHALLGVSDARSEDRAPTRDRVERRPLEREIQRVARRANQTRRADSYLSRPLRNGGQQRQRLVTRLGEKTVADPN